MTHLGQKQRLNYLYFGRPLSRPLGVCLCPTWLQLKPREITACTCKASAIVISSVHHRAINRGPRISGGSKRAPRLFRVARTRRGIATPCIIFGRARVVEVMFASTKGSPVIDIGFCLINSLARIERKIERGIDSQGTLATSFEIR